MSGSKNSRKGRLFVYKSTNNPERVENVEEPRDSSTSVAYKIKNNTGAYLQCVASYDPDTYNNTWFGSSADSANQVGYLVGDGTSWWTYNFYKEYGYNEGNTYYGTVTFVIKINSEGYPYLGQQTENVLYDHGVNSDGENIYDEINFNWQNFINYDPYTSANFGTNGYNDETSPNLFPYNYGLIGLNADYAYFPEPASPSEEGYDYFFTVPIDFVWGSSGDFTYFLTNSLTQSDQQYVWFPEQPARSNYTITKQEDGSQLITQVAPYQNGSCWSRAYGALTQNEASKEIDSADEAAKYGIGATYGTWSMDFCAGDDKFIVCESYYLTERPYLSPETTNNYGDGQAPWHYLEIDGIETLWQNNAAGYPHDSCLQGGAFCNAVYSIGFPVPVSSSSTYVGVWIRSTIQVIAAFGDVPANIIFTYYVLNEDGTATPITLANGLTEWDLSVENPSFCSTLTSYLAANNVKLYPYLSTWSNTSIPVGYSVTTKYKNYTYVAPKE